MTQPLSSDQTERKCTICKTVKPLTDFWKDSTKPLGVGYKCKECDKALARKYFPTAKERESYKKRHRANVKQWLARNPQKAKAHQVVNRLKLKGDKCVECGATENLHAHHPDYDKPKEVVTLCVPCHEKVHHYV